jgi:hypothetical protein
MTPSKFDLKALEYRTRAEEAAAAAKDCVLDRTREQHELAAQRWSELAEAEESRALSNRTRLAEAAAVAAGEAP